MKTLLLLLCMAPSMWAASYHVDQRYSGEDQDGSATKPFNTIAQASSVLSAGDTCYIHKGIYRETIAPVRSGTASDPILYTAYENETVIVSGTEVVENWQQYSGAIYKASVTMSLGKKNMVFYNSKDQQLARWPNDLDGDPYTIDAYPVETDSGTYSESYITHYDIPDYWNDGGVMFWLGAHSGCSVQREITGFDSTNHQLSFTEFPTNWPFGTHSPTRLENGNRGQFYLMNNLGALDAPGEWFYDESTQELYFYAPDGLAPSLGVVEVAARDRTLDVTKNYIHVENINLFGASIKINGSDCVMKNMRATNCIAGLITDEDGSTAGGAAVVVYGDRVSIEDCLIEEGSASGINIGSGADFTVVENCIILNFDKQGNHCTSIRSSGTNAQINYNKISGSGRDVLRVTGAGSVASYNEVSDGLKICADGGLFYVTGDSTPRNVELHHNWFYDAHAPDYTTGKATGIYLDNDTSGYNVHHNVVWNVGWGGLHFNWDAIENEIYNNTFWDVGDGEPVIDSWIPTNNGLRTDVRDNTLINNLSDVRTWWESSGSGIVEDEMLDNTFTNNIQVATSPFVSIADKNFMPINVPDVVDNGVSIEGITDGYSGASPDVGAYEYGGTRWIPGPDWEPVAFAWQLEDSIPVGEIITLQAVTNYQYLCADSSLDPDYSRLVANKSSLLESVQFIVEATDDSMIALKAVENGKYVSASKWLDSTNYPLAATATSIDDWEKFSWINNSDGTVSLLANSSGKYVTTDIGSDSVNPPIHGNADSIADMEKFIIQVVNTRSITLREGYQIVSLDFVPEILNVKDLFDPILENIEFIEASDRSKLYKHNGEWVNDIVNWDSTQAYIVKAKSNLEPFSIERSSTPLEDTINLTDGVNLVPTYNDTNIGLEAVFNTILESNIVWIRDVHGKYCRKVDNSWNDLIKETKAGSGLVIKVSGDCSLPIGF